MHKGVGVLCIRGLVHQGEKFCASGVGVLRIRGRICASRVGILCTRGRGFVHQG